ncbi:hypothetical protein Peur_032136 [Populus x canadensis]
MQGKLCCPYLKQPFTLFALSTLLSFTCNATKAIIVTSSYVDSLKPSLNRKRHRLVFSTTITTHLLLSLKGSCSTETASPHRKGKDPTEPPPLAMLPRIPPAPPPDHR